MALTSALLFTAEQANAFLADVNQSTIRLYIDNNKEVFTDPNLNDTFIDTLHHHCFVFKPGSFVKVIHFSDCDCFVFWNDLMVSCIIVNDNLLLHAVVD